MIEREAVALTVHITRDLGESAGSLGAVYSIFGLGTFVGALVALRLRHAPAWPALLGGNLLRGLALVGIAVCRRPRHSPRSRSLPEPRTPSS